MYFERFFCVPSFSSRLKQDQANKADSQLLGVLQLVSEYVVKLRTFFDYRYGISRRESPARCMYVRLHWYYVLYVRNRTISTYYCRLAIRFSAESGTGPVGGALQLFGGEGGQRYLCFSARISQT